MKQKISRKEAAEQFERLSKAIESTGHTIRRGDGQKTDIAKFLSMSAQLIQNWGDRGISKEGLIAVQIKTGCSLDWLLTGNGQMLPGQSTKQLARNGTTNDRRQDEFAILLSHMPKPARAMMLSYAKSLLSLMEKEPDLFADKKEISEWIKWTKE